jgi:UPF0755 protein
MSDDDWGLDDPLRDPDDPDAAAREQRRQEREARRREREGRQRPGEPEQPGAMSAGAAEGEPRQEMSSADRRLPSSPARAPLAGRVTAMRKRLSGSQAGGSTPPDRGAAPRRGSNPFGAVFGSWRRIAAVLAALLVAWFLVALFQPFHGDGGSAVRVTIPEGASAGDAGDLLDEAGVISSDAPFVSASSLFQLRIKLAGKAGDIKPGTYTLRRGESYGTTIDQLTAASRPTTAGTSTSLVSCASTCTVTIPEGLSRSQIAPYLRKGGLRGSYVKESVSSKYLRPNEYGAQGRARNLEGFLFPDTFELPVHAPVADLVQLQLQDFKGRIRGVDMSYARSKNLTTYDVLIIASMIEREVQVPRERRLVAAVIYNRLRDGMPLGIDATTRFAVGNYTTPLTPEQLDNPSPYNTRLHAGLPPGPIGNPGLAAIDAAAHPAKVDYLFYVVKPGTCGEHNFSSNEAQFLRDADAYQQALEAKGSSPTSC